ncbi:MAG: transglycosylase SLT domain-containing protein [Thermodesulfovibrionales bacterium]|nr:transglycosylase SLT domain-containing protein [Thermodesulfovibrionales bacterium]
MFAIFLLIIFFCSSPVFASESDYQYLSKGKIYLDNKQYEEAIEHLTQSIEKLPILSDYALYWRSIAYQNLKDYDKAIKDLKVIIEKFKDSPLYKPARERMLDILKTTDINAYKNSIDAYIKEFPNDYHIKYSYALYLKEKNESQKAHKLFLEVFLEAPESLSNKAIKEIDYNKLSAETLLKKANNLNKAWFFAEAERYFKEAQKRDKKGVFKTTIKEGLAYSLFRQKRYNESASLYKEVGDIYWYARSLLRAKEIAEFEKGLSRFKKSTDKRMVSVLISYSNIKRRNGEVKESLDILDELLKKHKSREEQEAILWAIGWNHYITRNYDEAMRVFSSLHEDFKDSKYLYWLNRTKEKVGKEINITDRYLIGYRDYYGYLNAIKNNQRISKIDIKGIGHTVPPPLERADILYKIGLKGEATREAIHSVRNSGSAIKTVSASSFLNAIGSYKYSVSIISKVPYTEGYHNLLYPIVFWDEVNEASRHTGIDPLLIMAVMREESRYDPDARSIAGAIGLMQLMPNTARIFQKATYVSLNDNRQLYNPRINIAIGSAYLKHLLKQFGSLPPSLAAYNAGEDPVSQWLKGGNYTHIDEFIEDIPYTETNNYVKKVLTSYFEYIRGSKNHEIDKQLLGFN